MFPDFQHPSIVLFFSIELIVYFCAGWKLFRRTKGESGGEPELYGAAILLLVGILQTTLYSQMPPVFSSVNLTALLVDMVLVVGLVAIALNANRIWPLFAAGAQLLGLFSHFSRAVQFDIDPMAYAILKTLPTGLVLVCIIIGFAGHFQRFKRNGYDQDWVDWSQNVGLGPSRG